MAYKHPGAAPPGGWPPTTLSQPEATMWQQPRYSMQQQTFNPFQFQQARGMPMNMNPDSRQLQRFRMANHPNEVGIMGPPPVPQKPFGVPTQGPMGHMSSQPVSPYSVPPVMPMTGDFPQDLVRRKQHSDAMSINHSQSLQNCTSENSAFRKSSQQPIFSQSSSQGAGGLSWHQNGISVDSSSSSNTAHVNINGIASADRELNFVANKNNRVSLDGESMDNLLGSSSWEAHPSLQDMLSSGSRPGKTASPKSWVTELKPDLTNSLPIQSQGAQLAQHSYSNKLPTPLSITNTNTPTMDTAATPHQLPTTDLRQIQPNATLQSTTPHPLPQLSSTVPGDKMSDIPQHAGTATHTIPLPHPLSLLPSMSGPVTGFSDKSNSQSPSNAAAVQSEKDKPKRRRRKRCGECSPCQQREDCGQCYVCKNKGQVNAICKARKCLVLRKKAHGSDSAASADESTPPREQAMEGPVDNQIPESTSLAGLPSSSTVIQSQRHHQSQQYHQQKLQHEMQPPQRELGYPPVVPMSANPLAGGQQPLSSSVQGSLGNGVPPTDVSTLPPQQNQAYQISSQSNQIAQSTAFYPSNKFFPPSVKSSSQSANPQLLPQHSKEQVSNMFSNKVQTSFPMHSMNFPSMAQTSKPWSNNTSNPNSVRYGKPHCDRSAMVSKPAAARQARPSPPTSDRLQDLYSVFKDDMQKMNERTYARANGVKVCKLMAKLLSLKITEEELRSSHPPKPDCHTSDFFTECEASDAPVTEKMNDDNTIINSNTSTSTFNLSNSVTSTSVVAASKTTISSCTVRPKSIAERQDHGSVQETDTQHSQGTTSDIEEPVSVLDSHNGVDSGFSSSSPADRQSPSPKDLFSSRSVSEEEKTTLISVTSDSQYLIPSEEKSPNTTVTNLTLCPPSQGDPNSFSSVACDKKLKQEIIDRSYYHQNQPRSMADSVPQPQLPCRMDVDAPIPPQPTSTIDIDMPDPPTTTSVNHLEPLNSKAANAFGFVAANRPGGINPNVMAYPNPEQAAASAAAAATESMKNAIDSLTAKITGFSETVKSEAKPPDAEQNDPAFLLKNNKVAEPPNCGCVNRRFDENIDGPYYVHLGAAASVAGIRKTIEKRCNLSGSAVRIEKVKYTTKEGKTSLGCPAAKWIIRRSSLEEKVLVVAKHRVGHYCPTAWIIVAIVVWEGVPGQAANHMYDYLTRTLPVYGYETERRCGTNQPRDCACQGWDMNRKGASFSFGCSWSVYYDGCKFARSQVPRKFKLRDDSFEGVMESKFQALGQHLAPLYKQMAPMSYGGQVRYESVAGDCRIGFRTGRPFSGCTATVDFCAHQHRDTHNMNNGCTVVVTLTKHRGLSKPEDEQLHTLPLYVLDETDEWGSREGILRRIESGALEVLDKFSQEQRRRSKPYKRRKKGTETYQSPKVKAAYLQSVKEKLANDNQLSVPAQLNPQGPAMQRAAVESAKQDLFNVPHLKHQPGTTQLPTVSGNMNMSSQSAPSHPNANMPTQPIGFPLAGTSGFQQPLDATTVQPVPPFPFGFPGSTPPFFSAAPQQQMLPNMAVVPNANNMSSIQVQTKPEPVTARQDPVTNQLNNDQYLNHTQKPVKQFSETAVSDLNQQVVSTMGTSESKVVHGGNSVTPPSSSPSEARPTNSVSTAGNLLPKEEPSSSCKNSEPSDEKADEVKAADLEDVDDDIQIPKPRPPSPEFDDPEGREVHEDNSHLFRDPTVGGVALALSHGAVLFEVAKREFHATTALRQPDRYNPTRISLVFYQHKRLNFKRHGYHEYVKAEEGRQKARREAKAMGIEYIPKGLKYKQKRQREAAARKGKLLPSMLPHKLLHTAIRKPGRKPGWKKKKQMRFAAYQYLWPQPINHPMSKTSNTTVTSWLKPECFVTGPYQKWVSLHTTRQEHQPPSIPSQSATNHTPVTSSQDSRMTLPPCSSQEAPATTSLTLPLATLNGPVNNSYTIAHNNQESPVSNTNSIPPTNREGFANASNPLPPFSRENSVNPLNPAPPINKQEPMNISYPRTAFCGESSVNAPKPKPLVNREKSVNNHSPFSILSMEGSVNTPNLTLPTNRENPVNPGFSREGSAKPANPPLPTNREQSTNTPDISPANNREGHVNTAIPLPTFSRDGQANTPNPLPPFNRGLGAVNPPIMHWPFG